MSKQLRVHITRAAEKKLRSGHPWLFAESILKQNRDAKPGEIAAVYDRQNRFLGLGLFDPLSPIRVRLLHVGSSQTLDELWWAARLELPLKRREGLFDQQTTGHRLIHGESDGWPGLVLDRYDQTLVLKLYTTSWLPHLDRLTSLFVHRLCPRNLVLRLSRNIHGIARENFCKKDGDVLHGDLPDNPLVFLESGLRFEVNVLQGQKTGFFLDQRENRRAVQALAQRRDVLNAFSFSGAFSVYAARGGARSVADLDISHHALESAKRNFDLNRSNKNVRSCVHRTVQSDAIEWLIGNATERFDMIILDPPSFAKRQADRASALRGYYMLVQSALKHLRSEGILVVCSCSAHISLEEFFKVVRQAASNSNQLFSVLQTRGHPPDHPATFKEAEYLKAIYLSYKISRPAIAMALKGGP